ncbi:MAG: peptidylprolyl isomerase [Candidatus Zixiibacteriota bacterium]
MRTISITLMIVISGLVLFGCFGGQKTMSVATDAGADPNAAPVFVETKLLNIDTEMMANQFLIQQLPVSKKIDSTIAINSAYEMLLDTILAKDYKKFDLSTVPHLQTQHDDMYFDYLLRLTYKKHIVDSVTVDSSEVLSTYDEYKERFFKPTMYRVQHIVVSGENLMASADSSIYMQYSDEQVDSIARAQVMSLRERIVGGASFDTLAIMYSQDPGSADNGGDLGYLELNQLVSPFDSTVEHTPVDSLSGVIKTRYGWHVLKVLDKSLEHYSPIDSVYGALASLVKEKKVAERGKFFLDSLRESGEMLIDTALVESVDTLTNPDIVLAIINPSDKVNGCDTIFFKEYRGNAAYLAQQLRLQTPLSLEDKLQILTTMSNKYHFHRAAILMGYDKDPEIVAWSENKLKRYAVSTMRKEMLDDGYAPSDEDMRAYYDSHMDDYQVERPLKIQHIVFQDSAMAEYVRDVATSGIEFEELIDQYYPGDPDIKQAAANLGYIGKQDMPAEFWRQAMSTPVGEVSRPVKTEYGFHIIKVLDRNHSIPFESAKNRIKTILMEKHKKAVRDNFVEDHIGGKPIFHWDVFEFLHYKDVGPPINPASMMGRM